MYRHFLLGCVLLPTFVTAALAQTRKLPPDLAGIPDEVKSLKWQTIDIATVQPLERCRALLLLNHTLDELSANATAEADLMSAYLEKNNLGSKFASTPPPPPAKTLTYPDAEKVAVAMLRGPMSSSYYATELGDVSPDVLPSYTQMYGRTCARRWSEFDESRHQVRCMSSFLGNSNKLQDYDAWATAEASRREAQARQGAAAPAAAKAGQDEAQPQQQQSELMQMKGGLAAADAQLQGTAAAAQQPSDNPPPADAVTAGYADSPSAYGYAYGGYGGYGYAYGAYGVRPGVAGAVVGANVANNNEAVRRTAAVQYHGANYAWNREPNYNSYARAQTEYRMSSFHGAVRRR